MGVRGTEMGQRPGRDTLSQALEAEEGATRQGMRAASSAGRERKCSPLEPLG